MSDKWIIYDSEGRKNGHIEKAPLQINPVGCLILLAIWFGFFINSVVSDFLSAPDRLSKKSKIDFDGLGTIKIGMTVKEAEKAGKIRLVPVQGTQIKNQGCFYVKPDWFSGIKIMLTNGRISRIEASNLYTKTIDDVGVDYPTSFLKSLYGKRATITPGKFKGQQYIEILSPKIKNRRIIFIANSLGVDGIIVGKLPEVRSRNGCN